MARELDRIHVEDFLIAHTDFRDFCHYNRSIVASQCNLPMAQAALLGFPALGGDSLIEKVRKLWEMMTPWPGLLVFNLAKYWFDNIRGASHVFTDGQIHQELCIAAQTLWRSDRDLAEDAFDLLANIDKEGFGSEWGRAKPLVKEVDYLLVVRPDSASVSPLGMAGNLQELVDHLACCHEIYQQLRIAQRDRQWRKLRDYLDELEQFQPGYGGMRSLLGRLNDTDLKRLERLETATRIGFLPEERWGADGADPYRLCQDLGVPIGPATPPQEVKATLDLLLRDRPELSGEQREVLAFLLTGPERCLCADVFQYPVRLSQEAAAAIIDTFLDGQGWPQPDALPSHLDEAAGAVALVLDRPDLARDIWTAAQTRSPRNAHTAHCLGLFHLAQAMAPQATDQQRRDDWHRAIAHWAVAMADTGYWLGWAKRPGWPEGAALSAAFVAGLGPRVQDRLHRLLNASGERLATAPGPAIGQELERLGRQLDREFAAVRLCLALGGVPLGGRLAWFGPLFADLYPVGAELPGFLDGGSPDPDPERPGLGRLSPPEARRRLRWYFSPLGEAATLLEGPVPEDRWVLSPGRQTTGGRPPTELDPERALAALEAAGGPLPEDCKDPACPVHGAAEFSFAPCCTRWQGCGAYADQAPAYRGPVSAAANPLCADALALAIEAQVLKVAVAAAMGAGLDARDAAAAWGRALRLAAHTADAAAVGLQVESDVLSLATAYERKSPPKLDAAVAVMEAALPLFVPPGRDAAQDDTAAPAAAGARRGPTLVAARLRRRLVDVLRLRSHARLEQRDHFGAEADLKRGLALVPEDNDVRAWLVNFWANLALATTPVDPYQALDYIRQAKNAISAANAQYPGYDWTRLSDWLARSQDNLTGHRSGVPRAPAAPAAGPEVMSIIKALPESTRLLGEGMGHLRGGRLDEALGCFDRALEQAPTDIEIQAGLCEALSARARRRIEDRGETPEALAEIEHQRPRLPGAAQESLRRKTDFLKHWYVLRQCLKGPPGNVAHGDLVYELRDYRELWLPFEAKNRDGRPREGSVVRAQVEVASGRDFLCLDAPLPVIPVADWAIAAWNLLAVSGQTPLFKLAYQVSQGDAAPVGTQLTWYGRLPFELLDLGEPDWFRATVFALSDYADLSLEQIADQVRLRDWFGTGRPTARPAGTSAERTAWTDEVLEAYCGKRQFQYKPLADAHRREIATGFGVVEVETLADAVRLARRFSPLPNARDREQLQRIIQLNTGRPALKLYLNEDPDGQPALILAVELSRLSEQALEDAFAALRDEWDLTLATLGAPLEAVIGDGHA